MFIVSTSKKTVLSDFENLETKSTYAHANEEATDFQFNAHRRVFVEVNKKAGLAVMRIREKHQNAPELQRVRKLTIENAYSVACAKTASNQIAIGQSSGCVKLFNFSSAQLIHRYPADQSGNTVLYVDYNCTDDYIAAVLDGGKINIYGTKIKQKIQTICNDDNPTLARYHPKNRFQLGVASEKGTVSVYDVQMNRSIFYVENAHDAPCRDVSMCSVQPWMLASVGYDSRINIFDIRRNNTQTPCDRLVSKHPMSTVALSECGIYICAGNLKGELITYDTRNAKSPLTMCSVHDGCAVTRCAFVPIPTEEQQTSSFSSSNNTSMNVSSGMTAQVETMPSDELRKSISANLLLTQQHLDTLSSNMAARQTRDSFCDFLDAQRSRGTDRKSTQTKTATSTHDSIDWEAIRAKGDNEKEQLDSHQNSLGPNSLNNANTETVNGPLRERCNISGDVKLKIINEADEHENSTTDGQQLPEEQANTDDLEERFNQIERELRCSADKTHYYIYMCIGRYWLKQRENIEDTYRALDQILNTDTFVKQFNGLQTRNIMLKQQLKQLRSEQENKGNKSTRALSKC